MGHAPGESGGEAQGGIMAEEIEERLGNICACLSRIEANQVALGERMDRQNAYLFNPGGFDARLRGIENACAAMAGLEPRLEKVEAQHAGILKVSAISAGIGAAFGYVASLFTWHK